MIGLFVLVGLALWILLAAFIGWPAVLSVICLLAVVGVSADVVRAIRDRRTVQRRWDAWETADRRRTGGRRG